MLHGFPTASHMFWDLIPLLADRYRIIASGLDKFSLCIFDYGTGRPVGRIAIS
ncbi:alpha/beta fold hydrolase [Acetobacter fallax]|uniref:alpha/beta fold hydrolase n=1 Tax=Acetobacter fallax TaxID=1737473 RepID=UPI0038CFB6C7